MKFPSGYSAITGNSQHSPGLVWWVGGLHCNQHCDLGWFELTGLLFARRYINGLMSPILYVRRGVTYSFKVEGGSDPTNLRFYNPLYLTTDASGGYAQLDDNTRKTVRIIGGISFDKKGRPTPTAVGRYCVWVRPTHFVALCALRPSLKQLKF